MVDFQGNFLMSDFQAKEKSFMPLVTTRFLNRVWTSEVYFKNCSNIFIDVFL